ncbi:MAG: succinate dehydrogenase assembly factor 2 [Gammaproteobacteria bacterium]|nr:succinate dehydrogenase assembly factor 2 [Gammaproteobacteria bacterium]NVK89455.1 succinate dehydrogenase assembly factor 2 [Gammaproteobacteria bacterium]
MSTPIDTRKVRYQCRRGLLELDVILQPFADRYLTQLNASQLDNFIALLECPDPDIYNWLMGQYPADTDALRAIVAYIREKMNITS